MWDIGQLKRAADYATTESSVAREKAEQCRDYYDGYQLTQTEIETLKKRKQPVVIANRVRRKIDAMIGIEQRVRTDPRALAREPRGQQAADVATKALVYLDDETRFDQKRSMAFENVLVEGVGGVEIVVEEIRGRPEVVVRRLRWEELFYDPHSREKDFSDATYIGVMKWMTLDAATALYGAENADMLQSTLGAAENGQTYDDRPASSVAPMWGDPKLRRVRIAQMYYQDSGIWHMATFTGGGILEEGPSAYMDEDGKPTCPIVLMTGYVDRGNRRYGVVQDMIYQQDEVNKRRSKLLHMLNTRQVAVAKGAVDTAALKREMSDPNGVVEIDVDAALGAREAGLQAFQVLQNSDQIVGQANLLTEAKNEIDLIGPNASLLGQIQGDQSGRAIMAQQQAGMAELAPLYDSLKDWTLRCYRQMWLRCRQFWTDERYVRITDDMQAPQFLQLNVIVGYDMFGQPIMENAPAQMDVDIIIDDAPDVVTLQQEEFRQLNDMANQGIPIPPEMLIEASSARNKQKILEMMQQQRQEAMQAQMAMAQAEMQLRAGEVQAKTIAAEAGAMRDKAAAAKDMASIPVMQVDARTKVLKAMQPAPFRSTAAG
jgi:hypothetical protein